MQTRLHRHVDEVKALVAETLGIEDRLDSMDASTETVRRDAGVGLDGGRRAPHGDREQVRVRGRLMPTSRQMCSRRLARSPHSSTPTGHDGVAWIAASSGLSVRPQIYRGRSQL